MDTRSTLTQKTVSGAFWASASRFGQQGLSLVATAILAHLLPPRVYGIVGMSSIATGFIALFTDMGMSSAIVQREVIDDHFLSSLFWTSLVLGVGASAMLLAAAPAVANFYHEPQLVSVFYTLSVGFIFSGVALVPYSLMNRQMAFKSIAIVELVASAAGSGLAVGLAVSGAGLWSLVFSSLGSSALRATLICIIGGWRPKFVWIRADVRSIARYSLNLSGFSVFNYFTRNADNLLIGRYLGATQLGYYQLAYNLMLYPIQTIGQVLGRVLFPAFARVQHENCRFRDAYLRVSGFIALAAFPLMVGLFLTADNLIGVVFGQMWLPCVPLVMILCPVGMMQAVGTTVGQIYTAKGRTDWMFYWGLGAGIVTVASFVLGLRWGAFGVAACYVTASGLLTYPGFAIPFRLIDLSMIGFAKSLTTASRYSLLMAVAVVLTKVGLARFGVTAPLPVLVVMVAVGATVYVGALLWRKPPMVKDLLSLLSESGFSLRRRPAVVA